MFSRRRRPVVVEEVVVEEVVVEEELLEVVVELDVVELLGVPRQKSETINCLSSQ
jgi:hypothetical protein